MWKWTNPFAPKETEFVELVNVDDEKVLDDKLRLRIAHWMSVLHIVPLC